MKLIKLYVYTYKTPDQTKQCLATSLSWEKFINRYYSSRQIDLELLKTEEKQVVYKEESEE